MPAAAAALLTRLLAPAECASLLQVAVPTPTPMPPAHQQPAGCTPAASPTQAHTPVVVDPAPLLLHTPHAAALQEGHGVLHAQQQRAHRAVGRRLPAARRGQRAAGGWVRCPTGGLSSLLHSECGYNNAPGSRQPARKWSTAACLFSTTVAQLHSSSSGRFRAACCSCARPPPRPPASPAAAAARQLSRACLLGLSAIALCCCCFRQGLAAQTAGCIAVATRSGWVCDTRVAICCIDATAFIVRV